VPHSPDSRSKAPHGRHSKVHRIEIN